MEVGGCLCACVRVCPDDRPADMPNLDEYT